MKLFLSWNIGTVDVSITLALCELYICLKETFTHNYIILKCWMNASFNTQVMLTESLWSGSVITVKRGLNELHFG